MAPPKILGICKVDECEADATSRGYCNRHYQLWYRHGRPTRPPYLTRAKKRLEKKFVPEPNSGCWLWIGSVNSRGYGVIVVHGKHHAAHRLSWIVYRGPIPDSAFICHKCDVPCCINPDHLYVGDAVTNGRDMAKRGQSLKGERNGNAKLTEQQVRLIRADGRSKVAIAKEFHVSNVLIGKIKRREVWGHIDG